MDKRLKFLLDKYWEGNTTVDEEKELKVLLNNSEEYPEESRFFRDLNLLKEEIQAPVNFPKKRIFSWRAMSIAAGVSLAVGTLFLFQQQKRAAEKAAFLEVMQAFELVNEHLNKGTQSMKSMEEFRHLKLTQEFIEIPK